MPLAVDGPLVSIRKFSRVPIHMAKLIELGSITEDMAKYARLHNDANVIALGARIVDLDTAITIVDTFLDTSVTVTAFERVARQVGFILSGVFAAVLGYISIQRRQVVQAVPSAVPPSPVPPVPPGAKAPEHWRARWDVIKAHLDSNRETDWKIAVIEADKLVDEAFGRAGFPGATFGDVLMNIAPGNLVSLDGVWWAHKVRNRLAHETDYFLRYTEARQAIAYYEAALHELRLLG